VGLTNNLIERASFSFYRYTTNDMTVELRNNLFRLGALEMGYPDQENFPPTWYVYDNLFDSMAITVTGGSPHLLNGKNGYYPATSTKFPIGSGGDVTLTNIDYQTSFLGGFYYPTTGTNLARLINAGSRTASSAGLSAFTSTTDQVADSGTVDIGYHSFAVNPNTTVTIQATEPVASESGQQGKFTVFRSGSTGANLTVYYGVRGTAVPGTDYQALSGTATIGIGSPSQEILVLPIDNNTITFDKTVVVSLILTNTYFVGILFVEEKSDQFLCAAPGVYIVHWEGGRFVVRFFPINAILEHVTFAPIRSINAGSLPRAPPLPGFSSRQAS